MLVKRLMVVACASLLLVAVGCSSSKKDEATVSSSTTTGSTGAGNGSSTTTAGASGGGSVAALCAAFANLAGLSGSDPANVAAGVADLKSAAQKFRDSAPPEVADSANAYADLIDQAASDLAAAGDDAAAQAAAAQSLGSAMSSKNILPVITWQANNCESG